jgi:hypothetical protein
VVVGGIYSPNHQTNRWGWAAVDGRTGQSGAPPDTIRCASHVTQPLGFDRWSSDSWDHRTVRWCTGQFGGAPDSHYSLSGAPSGAALTLRALSVHCSRSLFTFADDRWRSCRCSAWHTGQSGATPDSSVNYSGVALQKPEAEQFTVDLPGAPDTVRCARPGQPSVSFAPFFLNPNLDIFIGLC